MIRASENDMKRRRVDDEHAQASPSQDTQEVVLVTNNRLAD